MIDDTPEGERGRVAERVAGDVWAACRRGGGEAAHRRALWRATALLITTPGLHRHLLHAVGRYLAI